MNENRPLSSWRDPRLISRTAASVRAVTLRVMEQNGRVSANQMLRRQWPDDRGAEFFLLKAASDLATTSVLKSELAKFAAQTSTLEVIPPPYQIDLAM
jgi:hypothetical protein